MHLRTYVDQEQNSAPAPVAQVSWNSAADPADRAESEPVGEPAVNMSMSAAVNEIINAPTEGAQAAEVEAVEETPPVVAEAAEAAPDKLTVELDRIANHSKKLRAERNAVKAERAQLEAKRAEITSFQEQLKTLSTADALRLLGKDPREAVRSILQIDEEPQTAEQILQARLDKYEARFAQQDKAAEDAKAAAEQNERSAGMQRLAQQVEDGIRASGDEFELINAESAHGLVFDTQVAYWQKTGQAIDWRIAAQHVEKDLETRAEKLLATTKFSKRFTPVAAKPTATVSQTKSETPQAIPGSRTITTRPLNEPAIPVIKYNHQEKDLPIEDSIERMVAIARATAWNHRRA